MMIGAVLPLTVGIKPNYHIWDLHRPLKAAILVLRAYGLDISSLCNVYMQLHCTLHTLFRK